jgi:NADH-quinone oxidoreductase subunit E
LITLEAVTCLAACDRAPMFQVQSRDGLKYYEDMTVDKTMELIEALRHVDKETA